MPGQKIRIILKAFDHRVLDISAQQIMETAERTGAQTAHVHKDSREYFELRVHKRLIDILEPSSKTIDSLTRLNVPAGVDIAIKL